MEQNTGRRGRRPNHTPADGEASNDAVQAQDQLETTTMYQKYSLEVTPEFEGDKHIGFYGRFVEKLNRPGLTTRAQASQRQVDQINGQWHNSKVFLHPESEPMPSHVYATKSNAKDGGYTTEIVKH